MTAIILTAVAAFHLGLIVGWIGCAFIAGSGPRTEDEHERLGL